MEDLVTIRNKLSISFSMDPLRILKKFGLLIQFQKLMFHNFLTLFVNFKLILLVYKLR